MTVNIKRRRGLMLNVRLAYPGILGGGIIVVPPGFMLLTDDNGVYLTDDNGNYLMGEAS
jgi:hypothetical protein